MRLLLPLLMFLSSATAFGIGARWPISDTPRFWILGEGFGHFSFDASYFQTRENYGSDGVASAPTAMDRLHHTNLRAHVGFGFAPKLSIFAQADGRALSMSSNEAVATAPPHGTNTGLGDAFLGFRGLLYRSRTTDRVYPTEWSPESFVIIFEGTWNFPMYDTTRAAKPPLGDQSNDFSGIARAAWYTNEWLAFSAGSGYIYRTAGYAPLIPWTIRADFSLQKSHRWRFWTEFNSFESLRKNALALNTQQPDPIPNGSLFFKSYSPTIRTAHLGAGLLLSKEWELVAEGNATATGVNAAKGWGVGLGVTWRPYQVPEIKYDEYRQRQIERLQAEKREFRRRGVLRYGFKATIVRVSHQGNYVKIFYGENDRVRVGDTFYILPPDNLSGAPRRPVAFATVVQVLPDAAFLHIDERYGENVSVQEGFEARRVYFDVDEGGN